ncbi:rhophilin 2 [Echinococcus multilocularis]|uniref:Rhophilin 2 n=1 Tax=Echinococcus multilocularis TaxID=6211 RepID=A0A0S4MM52_ECHMU|nr:rhophilin 2 [Echinococcus multilocularis]
MPPLPSQEDGVRPDLSKGEMVEQTVERPTVSKSIESADALSEQTRWFVQARANLQVLRESFAHAPSRDMSPELLGFLIQVMQVSYPRLPLSSAPPSFSLSVA